ncbi:MAG: GTP-dependent dephospho-CoA kinase family protein [Methanohalobium sp.]|uniref:GTP-dependent dephospho-CoA kinase family protein n=1 Tax=Methanohalobium sp. TaxID=2837493 RepID=UPI003979BC3C
MGAQIELPENLRPMLRKYFGAVFQGTGKDTIKKMEQQLKTPTKLISVGDVTTFHLLESDIIPDIYIIDNRTNRKPTPDRVEKNHRFTQVTVDNPAGTITEDLVNKIENALLSKNHVRIFVNGEEDLAALPAILMAPINSIVLYGQPGEGVVLVEITKSKKEEVKDLLNKIIEAQITDDDLNSLWRKLNGY